MAKSFRRYLDRSALPREPRHNCDSCVVGGDVQHSGKPMIAWSPKPSDWYISAFIVAANALLLAQTQYLLTFHVFNFSFPHWAQGLARLDWLFTIALGVITWLVFAGIFHLTAILLNGRGELRRLVVWLGYGYLPQLIASAIV